MNQNDPTPTPSDADTRRATPNEISDRAAKRLSDHVRRAKQRQLMILEHLQPIPSDAPTCVNFNKENTEMTKYTKNAIAASRSRITAGIDTFDRTLSAKPVAIDGDDLDTPESLLDALSRSAIATAAADIAAFSRGSSDLDANETDNERTHKPLAIESDDTASAKPEDLS